MRIVILACALACAIVSTSEARPRSTGVCVETGTIMQPVCGMGHYRAEPGNQISRREARRIARGQALEARLPFGTALAPDTQRGYLKRKSARVPETINTFGKATVFGSGVIRSASGATARVSAAVASKFQCLVSALDNVGYPIKFMGGFGKRPFNASKHPSGNALDINQTARDVVVHRFPAGVDGMASNCGLFHGSQWRNADTGHFEVPGVYATRPSGRRYAHRRVRHHHYATAVH